MSSLSLTTTTTSTTNVSKFGFCIPCYKIPKNYRNLHFPHKKHRKFVVFAANDDNNIDSWDQMELKFGKLIGEDPKLTLAKIIGRKSNPELSYLEIEKLYNKKGNKAVNIEEVPFDVSDVRRKPAGSLDGLNLTRPVPKKGVKFETNEKSKSIAPNIKRPNQPVAKALDDPKQSVPNVALRKPTTFKEDEPRLAFKPKSTLQMSIEEEKERFVDMTMVRKPDPFIEKEKETQQEAAEGGTTQQTETDVSLLQKPEMTVDQDSRDDNASNLSSSNSDDTEDGLRSVHLISEMGKSENFDIGTSQGIEDVSKVQDLGQENDSLEGNVAISTAEIALDVALRGPPKRQDQLIKETSSVGKGVAALVNPIPNETSLIKEREVNDWKRAEDLIKTRGREEVELISSSTRGFVASFGSLIGFLPYRNLATKFKFLAFESWLRKKGLDPALYRQNLGIVGNYDATSKKTPSSTSVDPQKIGGEVSSDMKLDDLLAIYDQEKVKFLSSFVGQKIKVNVVLADKDSRKLIFSVKPKEKEESIERKRSLMAKLSVGDVVKCCIKKITYYGIFVEVEGVPALIHQTEVSWDATLDPTSHFKIGQIMEAKVFQLDFSLQRIFLSLKEITPDPLIEALEAVVGDHENLDGRLQAAEPDNEWTDVEVLMKELRQYKGVELVTKGRFFLSPGLAPTFQVYMASIFENQYKLLARAGNKVQEVIVETSMSKEEMKSAILTCTNRVE